MEHETKWIMRVHLSEDHEWLGAPSGEHEYIVIGVPRKNGMARIATDSKKARDWLSKTYVAPSVYELERDWQHLRSVAVAHATGAFDIYFNPTMDRGLTSDR
jgi:hypothetical protein